MKLLDEFRPKRKEGKESKYFPNPALFTKEKTYLARGAEHSIPADWRKFVLSGKEVILFDGKPIFEDEYELIKAEGKEALAFFVAAEGKVKKQAITDAEIVKDGE